MFILSWDGAGTLKSFQSVGDNQFIFALIQKQCDRLTMGPYCGNEEMRRILSQYLEKFSTNLDQVCTLKSQSPLLVSIKVILKLQSPGFLPHTDFFGQLWFSAQLHISVTSTALKICWPQQTYIFNAVSVTLQCVSQSPGVFIKDRLLGPTPRISYSVNLGFSLRIYISNKFQVIMKLLCSLSSLALQVKEWQVRGRQDHRVTITSSAVLSPRSGYMASLRYIKPGHHVALGYS